MPSATSSTAWDSIISRQAVSPPTPPGWPSRRWRIIWPVGQRASVWASNWQPPRPCGDASSLWPDGLPARRADSLCIFPGAGPGLSRPLSPWPGCEPSHSQPDGAIRNRPNASKLASARSASASCCVRSHYHAIPSLHRPLSRPGAATENHLPCHIGPNGAQAFSLVGSLIPICPAFTPPIGGFGLRSTGAPSCQFNSSSHSFFRWIGAKEFGRVGALFLVGEAIAYPKYYALTISGPLRYKRRTQTFERRFVAHVSPIPGIESLVIGIGIA